MLWSERFLEVVGPVIGHAFDGDNCCRLLMLEDYRNNDGVWLKVDWPGWIMLARVNVAGDAWGLHDQDYIYNAKKLVNPIDKPVKLLQPRSNTVYFEYIGQVYNKYTFDKHGLKLEDITRANWQNWKSIQFLYQKKVQSCLRELRTAEDTYWKRNLGTKAYLGICADYIDIFLSPILDLRSRIVLAFKVCFFFQLWKLWIKFKNHEIIENYKKLILANSFVSTQCFLDIFLSCHFVVLFIQHFRDKYPNLHVPLHLIRSDACEIFFSKVGGTLYGMERAYDFSPLLYSVNTRNHLATIEYGENGLHFGRVYKRMTNVWVELHPLGLRKQATNLGDYSKIKGDNAIILIV